MGRHPPTGWATAGTGTTWHRIRRAWPMCQRFGPYHGVLEQAPPEGATVCRICCRAAEKRALHARALRQLRTAEQERRRRVQDERGATAVLRHPFTFAGHLGPLQGASVPVLVRTCGRHRGALALPSPRAGEILAVVLIDQRDAAALGAFDAT